MYGCINRTHPKNIIGAHGCAMNRLEMLTYGMYAPLFAVSCLAMNPKILIFEMGYSKS